MRSGTTWDNILEEVRSENLQGKVAVFGCGDSISYGDFTVIISAMLLRKFTPHSRRVVLSWLVKLTPLVMILFTASRFKMDISWDLHSTKLTKDILLKNVSELGVLS